ncbi:transporter substrate-binding domain-containing protein [Roseomonas sp. CECT 9278]|uniref:transporter substrate-binding domain-containing protein n=1 Tax=Roseomonas sp. CECT 9278 TaxID=2845823 RepID=UPI001E2B0FFB|nr:transporter substrate-binding domain-containing protein [Roseomonas sp. CECT 9278]CAH0298638.1 Cyclohexadienyl dehydratase [Roseomonas sp. CECT 9278]
MFRRTLPAAALATGTLAIPAQAQAPGGGRLAAIQSAGRIRIGTTGDFNPISFRDPASREYRGHQIDCAHQLGRDMNLRIEFVATDWRTLTNAVNADQFDIVMAGTSISVARAAAAAFTIPWGRTGFVPLVRRRDANRFAGWDALNQRNVTIATSLGTTMEVFVQQALPNATLRRVESPARDWQELLGGRVDASVTSTIEAAFLTREYPDLVAILRDQPRNTLPMAFMARADDAAFLRFLDTWVRLRQESGFFDELARKWGLVAS